MPAQAAVQVRARGIRVQEIAHHSQQVVEGYQQRRAQGRRNALLGRGPRRLQPVRRVAAILDAIAVLLFVDGLFRRPVSLCQNRGGPVTRLDC